MENEFMFSDFHSDYSRRFNLVLGYQKFGHVSRIVYKTFNILLENSFHFNQYVS